MDICRRSVKSIFDVNQNTSSIMSNLVPPSTSNLTVSFNNQINALHTQVLSQHRSMYKPQELWKSFFVYLDWRKTDIYM